MTNHREQLFPVPWGRPPWRRFGPRAHHHIESESRRTRAPQLRTRQKPHNRIKTVGVPTRAPPSATGEPTRPRGSTTLCARPLLSRSVLGIVAAIGAKSSIPTSVASSSSAQSMTAARS
eukprot:scaffold34996_cov65-Phaeocystis_antarctica.AAC.2